MRYLIRLLKTARAYRKAYHNAFEQDPYGENKAIWNDLEDKEHELIDVVVFGGK